MQLSLISGREKALANGMNYTVCRKHFLLQKKAPRHPKMSWHCTKRHAELLTEPYPVEHNVA